MSQKKLTDLTIRDNFLFGAVMMEEKNCKDFLEMVLGFQIERIEISKEKSIVYHPEYKGVRLDIYARDEKHTCYNVEMQAVSKPGLGKRSRYYHSQIDMELLLSGKEYDELPAAYVIFICDFDPFGRKKYQYTFQNSCMEDGEANLEDESCTIFLSTQGTNPEEVPGNLVNFLEFVKADTEKSKKTSEDPFVNQIQKTIEQIQYDREMRERFMIFQEMLKEERDAGRQEGLREGRQEGRQEIQKEAILKTLKRFENVPETLQKRVEEEQDSQVLDALFDEAIATETLEQFLEKAECIFTSSGR